MRPTAYSNIEKYKYNLENISYYGEIRRELKCPHGTPRTSLRLVLRLEKQKKAEKKVGTKFRSTCMYPGTAVVLEY